MIKLIILDIDGVMTNGKKYYGLDGLPFAKTYCDKDFTAIKRFKGAGVHVCFLSGDDKVNKAMAKNRNIDFYSSRGLQKADQLELLCKNYKVSPDEIVYVGDDLFDREIMRLVRYPFCPSDACSFIKYICGGKNILQSKAGENVIMELFDVLHGENLIEDCPLEAIEKLDEQEIF